MITWPAGCHHSHLAEGETEAQRPLRYRFSAMQEVDGQWWDSRLSANISWPLDSRPHAPPNWKLRVTKCLLKEAILHGGEIVTFGVISV